jgi:hypothetical protein
MGTKTACVISEQIAHEINYTEQSLFLQISGGFGSPNPFRGEIADSFSQTPNDKQQHIIRSRKSFIIIHSSFIILINDIHLFVAHDSRAASATAAPLLL